MRLFKMINANGESFDLMRGDAFFSAPGGLGFSKEILTTQCGDDFVNVATKSQQKVITGTMAFKGYEQYAEFIDFVKKKPLKLGYKPLDTWTFIDCDIQSLSKGEMEHDHKRLYCEINFLCYSKWYVMKYASTTIKTIDEFEDRKEYEYLYPYSYRSTYSGQIDISVSEDGTPLKLTIHGPCSNPAYTAKKGDVTTGKGQFFVELSDQEKLVVDANPRTMEASIYSVQGEYLRDAYANSNFNTKRFLYLPQGKNTITVSRTGTTNVLVAAEVNDYVDTV